MYDLSIIEAFRRVNVSAGTAHNRAIAPSMTDGARLPRVLLFIFFSPLLLHCHNHNTRESKIILSPLKILPVYSLSTAQLINIMELCCIIIGDTRQTLPPPHPRLRSFASPPPSTNWCRFESRRSSQVVLPAKWSANANKKLPSRVCS